MTNKDEELKMAIEALEHASERSIIINAYEEVIDACEEALEIANCDIKQPAQEPVAWMETIWVTDEEGLQSQQKVLHDYEDFRSVPLYTHPHQWQGLTDDEINEVCLELFETPAVQGDLEFCYAIEQALKEKNT